MDSVGRFDTLPKGILFHILQFVEDLSSVAAANKLGRTVAENIAEKRLRHFENKNGATMQNWDWGDWRVRLCTHAVERIRRCYNENRNGRDSMPYPKFTSRLLLSCAEEIPLSRHSISRGGPAAVLPAGDFAFHIIDDSMIRIFNHRRGGFHTEYRAQGSTISATEPNELERRSSLSYTTCTVLDSNEFLALKMDAYVLGYSIWLKQDYSFVRDIFPSDFFQNFGNSRTVEDPASIVTRDDGTIYFVAMDWFKIYIEAFNVESGERVLWRTDEVQGGVHEENGVLQNQVMISGRKLMICRCIYDCDAAPKGSMGIYILDRDRPNSPLQHFPCFDQGPISLLDYYRYVVFSQLWCPFRNYKEGEEDGPLRAVSLSSDVQQMRIVDELVQLGERKHVLHFSDTRVYTSDTPVDRTAKGGKEVIIDVYDIASNKKLRTIFTGLSEDDCTFQYLISNNEVLLCTFFSYNKREFIVLTFVL